MTVEDGIEAVRNTLSRCYFDETKTNRGINALSSYHKAWDEKKKIYKDYPEHDWSSHGSDAFRYLSLAIKEPFDTNYRSFDTGDEVTSYGGGVIIKSGYQPKKTVAYRSFK